MSIRVVEVSCSVLVEVSLNLRMYSMFAGSPKPSVICRISQSLFRNTSLQLYSLSCLYVSQSNLESYMSWKLTGTTSKRKKIKEMKRKLVLQTACFYLKKFGGYTSLLRKKMHIEQSSFRPVYFLFLSSLYPIYFLI